MSDIEFKDEELSGQLRELVPPVSLQLAQTTLAERRQGRRRRNTLLGAAALGVVATSGITVASLRSDSSPLAVSGSPAPALSCQAAGGGGGWELFDDGGRLTGYSSPVAEDPVAAAVAAVDSFALFDLPWEPPEVESLNVDSASETTATVVGVKDGAVMLVVEVVRSPLGWQAQQFESC